MRGKKRMLAMGGGLLGLAAVLAGFGFLLVNRGPGPRPTDHPPASTTPSASDIRAEVEQAYLRFWEALAGANLALDPKPLGEVATGEALATLSEQLEEQRAQNQPVLVRVEHDYQILVTAPDTASVDDRYVNHTVRLDPVTRQPIEPDPNAQARDSHTMRKVDGTWKVAEIIEYQ